MWMLLLFVTIVFGREPKLMPNMTQEEQMYRTCYAAKTAPRMSEQMAGDRRHAGAVVEYITLLIRDYTSEFTENLTSIYQDHLVPDELGEAMRKVTRIESDLADAGLKLTTRMQESITNSEELLGINGPLPLRRYQRAAAADICAFDRRLTQRLLEDVDAIVDRETGELNALLERVQEQAGMSTNL